MLNVFRKKKFEKDVELAKRRRKDLNKLKIVLEYLGRLEPLPSYYRDHCLKGEFSGCRECHIEPDWLLIYCIERDYLILIRTGSHSDLY
ncbi:MAG: type II toxin-antitoxin system YafQ family toxin [Gammaproteobacteria bacterium]